MKAIITSLLIIISLQSFGQENDNLSVIMPKKAVWAFAYYVSESPAWDNRKLPDQLRAIVGSDNNPDSLINITVKAKTLAIFLNRLQAERNEAVRDFYRSVLLNLPAIPGYTALSTQITNKANGSTSEKAAATYVRDEFTRYQTALQALWTDQLQRGIDWIKN